MRTFSLDYRFKAADGTWRWVHDEAIALRDAGGAGYWQGFMLDITQRKEVEEQLREAELKFRTIVEHSQAVFYTQEIDPHDPTLSNTTYIAPGNTELVGYTLEDIQLDPGLWRRIIHPEDRERVLAADAARNTGGGDHFSMEFRMIRKDGRIVWVQDEATLVRIPGKTPYWQGFMLDVTERKMAEEQLARALDVEREAAQRLRSVDEMKNTFLQAVSHDLRTPLAAILGLAITLERGDVHLAEDDARDLAGRIAENARKLERLVTNLWTWIAWPAASSRPSSWPPTSARWSRRVVAESNMIEPSRLTVDTHPVTIEAEAAKIERIVENLLANTARHTPTNAHVWVTVREVRGRRAAHGGGQRRRCAARAPRDDLRAVPPGSRGAAALAGRRGGPHLGETLRRAPRRSGVDRGARGRWRIVPGVPARGRTRRQKRPPKNEQGGWSRGSERGPGGHDRVIDLRGPTCAAPPGEPRPLTSSLKNSALIGVNCFHSAGTSSS